jgi:branched-chain amino acid transport system substrate-binding protein
MVKHIRAAALGAAFILWAGTCCAQPAATPHVKIGILTDMGSVFSDFGGPGSVIAAQMAVRDSAMADKVELVSADHQNKPDIGAGLARAWFEQQGVDAIFDVPTSSVALAVNTVAGQDKKLVFFSTAIIDRITEEDCNGYGIAWTWNIWSVARSAAILQMQRGYKSWYIIGQDYAAGHALEQTARQIVQAGGGTVVGSTFHPLGETDYSAYLVQASSSDAKLIMLTAGGSDLINELKQSKEFNIASDGREIGTFYIVITDVHAVGLETMQGLNFVTAFYWDRDDASRAFARRFEALHNKMPTMFQAGVYSAVSQYLKAVQATGSTQADVIRTYLQAAPIEDVFAHHGRLLPNGSMIHDMMAGQIKTPSESKAPWDYYNILGVVPAAQAFRGVAESKCALR